MIEKSQCPKCGSSDVSSLLRTKSENSSKESLESFRECNDCRYEWK